jgi:glycosyltransferase involved in cell wall biosynthesis
MDGVPGGSFYSARLLIKGLIDKGYNTFILFYIKNPIMKSFLKENAKVLKPVYKKKKKILYKEDYGNKINSNKNILIKFFFEIFLKNTNRCKYIFYELYQLYYIVKTIKKNKIQIVHLNDGITTNRDGIIAAKLCGVKCIVHERKIRKYDNLDIFLSKFVNVIITISNSVYDNCLRYPINQKKLKKIYNPIKLNSFDPKKVKQIKDRNNNLPIISIIGNITPWKGQLKFLEAINIIYNTYHENKFMAMIIGGRINQEYYKKLKNYCMEKKIEKYVKFIDFVYDIENYMQACDIIVHASQKPEPFGRVVAEAISLGKIVIATNSGGPKEIIVHGKNGLLFEPQNANDLANKILDVLHGSFSVDRKKISEQVLKRFSLNRHIEKVVQHYNY